MEENNISPNKSKHSLTKWIILGIGFIIVLMITYLIATSVFRSSFTYQSENTPASNPLTLLYLSENGNGQQIHLYDVANGLDDETNIYLPQGESPEKIVWHDVEHIVFVSQEQGFIELDLKSGGTLAFESHTVSWFKRMKSRVGSLDWCSEIEQFVVTGSGFSPDFGWVELINSSGKIITQVSVRSGYTDIACSPNGSRVAVIDTIQTSGMISLVNQSQNSTLGEMSTDKDIYLAVMTLADGETTRLTNQGFAIQPDWSPDGSQITFVGHFAKDSLGKQIYLIDLANKESQALTAFEEGNLASPVWSPDGKMIAFVKDGDIWLLQIETGELTQLTQTAEKESAPVWHP